MNILRRCALALPLLALGSPAFAATNLTGPYTVTVTGHPASGSGQTYCAVLTEDGSTLNYPNSGTFTIAGQTGKWFTKNFAVTFEVSSGADFTVFSGVLGKPQITGTSFIQVVNGAPVFAGTFTATKGCASE